MWHSDLPVSFSGSTLRLLFRIPPVTRNSLRPFAWLCSVHLRYTCILISACAIVSSTPQPARYCAEGLHFSAFHLWSTATRCSGMSLTDSYLVEEVRYRDQIVTRLHTVMVCDGCVSLHALFMLYSVSTSCIVTSIWACFLHLFYPFIFHLFVYPVYMSVFGDDWYMSAVF